jgi:hypothetical protein
MSVKYETLVTLSKTVMSDEELIALYLDNLELTEEAAYLESLCLQS